MPRMIRAPILALVLSLALLVPGRAAAQDCAGLAAQAGAEAGLPEGLLPAIALVESGRGTGRGGIAPWPWTLNQGGKGMYFDTREEALAYLKQAVAEGVTNIDVGCMQLNWKWHAAGFASPEDMIDPARNTRYAARFMVELYNRLGSWDTAAAAYHSTTPDRGQRLPAKGAAARDSFRAHPPRPGDASDGAPGGAGEGRPPHRHSHAARRHPRPCRIAALRHRRRPPADGFTGETPSDDPSVAAPAPAAAPATPPALIAAADARRPPPGWHRNPRHGGPQTRPTAPW